MPTYIHAYMLTLTHIQPHTHTNTQTHKHTCIHMYVCTYVLTYIQYTAKYTNIYQCSKHNWFDTLSLHDSMRCSSWDSSTTLFHTLKTVKGLLHLVPSRTPRSSGYGVLCTCVYVTCYFCYMFRLGPSSGSTGSVRVYRSACEQYTPNIYRCIPT